MADEYPPVGQRKIDLAVDTISRLDHFIPKLDYQGALVMFAPYDVVMAPKPYQKGDLQAAAMKIDTDFHTAGRPTPMGDGLMDVDSVIGGLSGRTALIMLTDGDSNASIAPVPQARALYSKYGKNLCIHVISFADNPRGQRIIDQIHAMSGCYVPADAESLGTDAAMAQYVSDVFYGEARAMPKDSDGDGVTDDKDQCPGTVKGAVVDDRGCELKLTLHLNFDFDKAEIKPEFKDQLAKAAAFVREHDNIPYILLAGHTDSQGPEDYNQDLSLRRAQAVRQALIDDYGVKADKLKARGYGESRPVASNDTKEGRYQNRRVELICCVVMPE
jgi:OOP family OmpA-OmpF porin